MTTMLEFDAEAARQVEAVYLTADVVQRRREVLRLLGLTAGEAVLDIGSGPGLLATDIAQAVGPAGRVCGIDISDSMLTLARGRAVPAGSAPVEYRHGGADAVPYPDRSFDAAISTQVLEYVADIPAALAEAFRLLRPGGRLLVLDTDWDSIVWHSTDLHRMRRILLTWEQHLADPILPRTLGRQLRRAGFDVVPPRVLPLLNVGYETATYSGGLLPIVARFVTGRDGWTAAEVDGWVAELRTLGADYFFSLNRYVFCATRRSARPGSAGCPTTSRHQSRRHACPGGSPVIATIYKGADFGHAAGYPARAPDRHQPVKPALCRDPGHTPHLPSIRLPTQHRRRRSRAHRRP